VILRPGPGRTDRRAVRRPPASSGVAQARLGPGEPADHPAEERYAPDPTGVIGSRAQIPAAEDDRPHALGLEILVDAVQVCNARYLPASIAHLHAVNRDVVADEQALSHVAPVRTSTR